jgi:hypothetical protein
MTVRPRQSTSASSTVLHSFAAYLTSRPRLWQVEREARRGALKHVSLIKSPVLLGNSSLQSNEKGVYSRHGRNGVAPSDKSLKPGNLKMLSVRNHVRTGSTRNSLR